MTQRYARPHFEETLNGLGFEKYEDYLKSEHWLELKRKYAFRKCHVCSTAPCHLHHRTYIRLGKEAADDLISLCKECHTKAHELVKLKKAKLHNAHEKLRQIHIAEGQPKKKAKKPRVPRSEIEKDRRAAMLAERQTKTRKKMREEERRRLEQSELRKRTGHDPSSPFRHLKTA